MHDSFKRLLDAGRHQCALKRAETPALIGKLLGASLQKITNWKSRGVSKEGALLAEELIGCSALWVMTGAGSAFSGQPATRLTAAETPFRRPEPAWPFRAISRQQIEALDDDTLRRLEDNMAGFLAAVGSIQQTAAAA